MRTRRDMWVCDESILHVSAFAPYSAALSSWCTTFYVNMLFLICRWWKAQMYTGSFGPQELPELKPWCLVLPAPPAITTTRLLDCCWAWLITFGVRTARVLTQLDNVENILCMIFVVTLTLSLQIRFSGPKISSSLWMSMIWLVCKPGWRATTTPMLQVIHPVHVNINNYPINY